MEPPRKPRKYEASFKLKVIEVAKETNNCAAARIYDVTEEMDRVKKKSRFFKKNPKA